MSKIVEKFLQYRGNIKAGIAVNSNIIFVTTHEQKHPTAIYRINLRTLELQADNIPSGATEVIADNESIYAACENGQIIRRPFKGGALTRIGPIFQSEIKGFTFVAENQLAVLTDNEICIFSRDKGTISQKLSITESGVKIVSDQTGKWLAVGTLNGKLIIFERENKQKFERAESEKIHNGEITAMMFDNSELKVYSAGSDNRLFLTHARGKLESEDITSGKFHTEAVKAITQNMNNVFYTGGLDSQIKVWTKGKARHTTYSNHVHKIVDMELSESQQMKALVAFCQDNTIRIFELDTEEKITNCSFIFKDVYSFIRNELTHSNPSKRETALKLAAGINDKKSISIISNCANNDTDHSIRVLATKMLGESNTKQAYNFLENLIYSKESAISVEALLGMRKIEGAKSLKPLIKALQTGNVEVGIIAINAIEELAYTSEDALEILVNALDNSTFEIRRSALFSLEEIHGDSCESDLIALKAKTTDIRKFALFRCYRRGFTKDIVVQAALRKACEDTDPGVRQDAFLISVMSIQNLTAVLRGKNSDINRLIYEIENYDIEDKPMIQAAQLVDKDVLKESDYLPLLFAMGSRSVDICLWGAKSLALIEDKRAFGTLLQLSREQDVRTRIETCKGFKDLKDMRSLNRLKAMLRDKKAEVRDSAFSALQELLSNDTLQASEAGLTCDFEDIRRRGLKILIDFIKSPKFKDSKKEAMKLVEQALNDSSDEIRSEAFKSSLNLKIMGSEIDTLTFLLKSIHPDIRREVLLELMSKSSESYSLPMIYKIFDDESKQLRVEAFEYCSRNAKSGLAYLSAGLKSKFSDIRIAATQVLVKQRIEISADLLGTALEDDEEKVRSLAIEALCTADEQKILNNAIQSKFPDVKIRAAFERACHGDPKSLLPLLDFADSKEPDINIDKWLKIKVLAINGLTELELPDSMKTAKKNLKSKHLEVRIAAVRLMTAISNHGNLDELKNCLQSDNAEIKLEAALGLAYHGDLSGASIIFNDTENQRLLNRKAKRSNSTEVKPDIMDKLNAAVSLVEVNKEYLLSLLDNKIEKVRNKTLLIMMLLELSKSNRNFEYCLAGISAEYAQIRLTAALGIEKFRVYEEFKQFIADLINIRTEGKNWNISVDSIVLMGLVLTYGKGILRVRAARILDLLTAEKPIQFDFEWKKFTTRYSEEIKKIFKETKKLETRTAVYSENEINQLVFGVYVGISRQISGKNSSNYRKIALTRLLKIVQANEEFSTSVKPIFIKSLSDPSAEVRKQAFENLTKLNIDRIVLGREAISSGQLDIEILGMKLLIEDEFEIGNSILENIMLTHFDGLELEAAELLKNRTNDIVYVSKVALKASSTDLREAGIMWLTQIFDKSPQACEVLKNELQSKYKHVRIKAAVNLVMKKEPAVFDALVEMLNSDDRTEQYQAINHLNTLDDPRTLDVFLKKIDEIDETSPNLGSMFDVIGRFRDPIAVPHLLRFLENRQTFWSAYNILIKISGYDQRFFYEETEPTPDWEKDLHPRNNAVLAQLLPIMLKFDPYYYKQLFSYARWAKTSEIDPVIADLVSSTNNTVRHLAVEIAGFRFRRRNASFEPLLRALKNPDQDTQFLAAEGLALGGRNEGLNILMTSIDLLYDYSYRQRAVIAVGELGDKRAVDFLLKLVIDETRPLREQAAEALGHMSNSEKADEIFKILADLAKQDYGLGIKALTGLRWFGGNKAWEIIRSRAKYNNNQIKQKVAELLAYDRKPASIKILTDMVKGDDFYIAKVAVESLRKIYDTDKFEADYIVLQSKFDNLLDGVTERIKENADASKLFEIIPNIRLDQVKKLVKATLLSFEKLPLNVAEKYIISDEASTIEMAAHIIGRAGISVAHKFGQLLLNAAVKIRNKFDKILGSDEANTRFDDLDNYANSYSRIIWALYRLDLGGSEAAIAATEYLDIGFAELSEKISLAGVKALSLSIKGFDATNALKTVILNGSYKLKTIAYEGLKNQNKTAAQEVFPFVTEDSAILISERELNADNQKILEQDGAEINKHGAVLPSLIKLKDVSGLYSISNNKDLNVKVRVAAIDALANIATTEADEKITLIAQSKEETLEIKKAAWRALRRLNRFKNKQRLQKY